MLARIGYDPTSILKGLREMCQKNGYPNGYIYFLGGGVETASTVPSTIDEMLLQSHQGVLRLFPVWPREMDAHFNHLRAYGAFLVSGELSKGAVKGVVIESEKGRPCTLQNPWRGKAIALYLATSCRSGLEALKSVSTQIEMPNVISVVTSAIQRKIFFLSLGTNNKTSTPRSGKKVRSVRGWRIKSM